MMNGSPPLKFTWFDDSWTVFMWLYNWVLLQQIVSNRSYDLLLYLFHPLFYQHLQSLLGFVQRNIKRCFCGVETKTTRIVTSPSKMIVDTLWDNYLPVFVLIVMPRISFIFALRFCYLLKFPCFRFVDPKYWKQ